MPAIVFTRLPIIASLLIIFVFGLEGVVPGKPIHVELHRRQNTINVYNNYRRRQQLNLSKLRTYISKVDGLSIFRLPFFRMNTNEACPFLLFYVYFVTI